MNNCSIKFITLLLIPCLVADSATAFGWGQGLPARTFSAPSAATSVRCSEEAIVPAILGAAFSYSFDRVDAARLYHTAGALLPHASTLHGIAMFVGILGTAAALAFSNHRSKGGSHDDPPKGANESIESNEKDKIPPQIASKFRAMASSNYKEQAEQELKTMAGRAVETKDAETFRALTAAAVFTRYHLEEEVRIAARRIVLELGPRGDWILEGKTRGQGNSGSRSLFLK